jgi:hypothetical protein
MPPAPPETQCETTGLVVEMTPEDVIDILAALDAGGIATGLMAAGALMRCSASRPEHIVTSTLA